MTLAIILDTALDAPPRLVWRALTETALLSRWLGENDMVAEIGRRFRLTPDGAAGSIDCQVLEVEPDRRLSYRWRVQGDGSDVLDSQVTWILEPTLEGGTRLRLVHEGFPIVAPAPRPCDLSAKCANDNFGSTAWAA